MASTPPYTQVYHIPHPTPAKSNVSCRRAKNLVEGNLAEESDFPELLCPFFTDKIESGFYDGKNIIQNMQGDFRRILRNDAMAGPCEPNLCGIGGGAVFRYMHMNRLDWQILVGPDVYEV